MHSQSTQSMWLSLSSRCSTWARVAAPLSSGQRALAAAVLPAASGGVGAASLATGAARSSCGSGRPASRSACLRVASFQALNSSSDSAGGGPPAHQAHSQPAESTRADRLHVPCCGAGFQSRVTPGRPRLVLAEGASAVASPHLAHTTHARRTHHTPQRHSSSCVCSRICLSIWGAVWGPP